MEFIKNMFGVLVAIPLGGAAISGVGSALTGGIGRATQSLVAIGVAGQAASLSTGFLKMK